MLEAAPPVISKAPVAYIARAALPKVNLVAAVMVLLVPDTVTLPPAAVIARFAPFVAILDASAPVISNLPAASIRISSAASITKSSLTVIFTSAPDRPTAPVPAVRVKLPSSVVISQAPPVNIVEPEICNVRSVQYQHQVF